MPTSATSPAEVLAETRRSASAVGNDGVSRPINSEISETFSTALSGVITRENARVVIEIGMACGFSTLSILDSLPADGKLFSVDPYQYSDYHGMGMALVAKTNRADAHVLIQEPDYFALPRFLTEGMQADLIYIDGMHTFDYVALDAFYAHSDRSKTNDRDNYINESCQ